MAKSCLVLISATENDRLIGIAPLFIADYDGQRALMLVGSIEISDYLDLIVRARIAAFPFQPSGFSRFFLRR